MDRTGELDTGYGNGIIERVVSISHLYKLLFLICFFQIISLQVNKLLITFMFCFHVNVYPCCFQAWKKYKIFKKVVFIVLKFETRTVCKKNMWYIADKNC